MLCERACWAFQAPFLLGLMAEVAIRLQCQSTAEQALAEALSLIEQTGERQAAPQLSRLRDTLKG